MLSRAVRKWTRSQARHLLNRAGFGGSPREVQRLFQMGREGAVDFLLKAEGAADADARPEWTDVQVALAEFKKYREEIRAIQEEVKDLPAEEGDLKVRERRSSMQRKRRERQRELQVWWFGKMLISKVPLREKMVLFWHDHFASSNQKVSEPLHLYRQNELFREHALGSFRKLTHEIVEDPAMMIYLDTQRSNKAKPNENFARELMELFTLGEGNYSEEDVKEAARALTGYRLNQETLEVVQRERAWDKGEKTIFGKTGGFRGGDVVDLILEQEACSRFMVTKLWEYFAYEGPEGELIDSLAKKFRESDYGVGSLLREIFLSKAFYSRKAMGTQIKSPVQYLVQLFKELEMDSAPDELVVRGLDQLGQVLFRPPNVAGWNWGQAWINTSTLLARYNIAGICYQGQF